MSTPPSTGEPRYVPQYPGQAQYPRQAQYPGPYPPSPYPDRSERPGAGIVVCAVGFLFALLGVLALPWAKKTTFFDVYRVVDHHGSSFNGATVVAVVLTIPFMISTGLLGVLASVSRVVARWASAVVSVIIGGLLIALVVWIETGHVGSDSSRQEYKGAIYGLAVLGGVLVLLSVGLVLEKSAWLARSLIAVLAVIALVLHVAAVADLFHDSSVDPGIGIWFTGIGYAAIAVGVLLPYRRVTDRHMTTATAHSPAAR